MNSDSAITRCAARATRGTKMLLYVRVHRLNACGYFNTARSWTLTTSGVRPPTGARKLGQCRTSRPRTRRGSATGYHHASRATVASLPEPPHASRSTSTSRSRCGSRPSRYRAVPARVWRSGETSIPTCTGHILAAAVRYAARNAAPVARGLVERRVRRRDDRHAARHRLEDGNPEAPEARRKRDDIGAPI